MTNHIAAATLFEKFVAQYESPHVGQLGINIICIYYTCIRNMCAQM